MKLQKWLTRNRWSRGAFALKLGKIHKVTISRQSVDAYINGKRKPGKDFIQATFEFTDGEVNRQDIRNSR